MEFILLCYFTLFLVVMVWGVGTDEDDDGPGGGTLQPVYAPHNGV